VNSTPVPGPAFVDYDEAVKLKGFSWLNMRPPFVTASIAGKRMVEKLLRMKNARGIFILDSLVDDSWYEVWDSSERSARGAQTTTYPLKHENHRASDHGQNVKCVTHYSKQQEYQR